MAESVRESVRTKGDARARLTSLALAYAAFMSLPATRAIFRMVTSETAFRGGGRPCPATAPIATLGGAAIEVIEDLVASGELAVDRPAWAAGQLLGMLDHATLVLGLFGRRRGPAGPPAADICTDAVETFLARYGNPSSGAHREPSPLIRPTSKPLRFLLEGLPCPPCCGIRTGRAGRA
jgi:hypothetical protein